MNWTMAVAVEVGGSGLDYGGSSGCDENASEAGSLEFSEGLHLRFDIEK